MLLRIVGGKRSRRSMLMAGLVLWAVAGGHAFSDPQKPDAPAHHLGGGFINPNGATGPGPVDFFFDRLRLADPAVQASRAPTLSAEESLAAWHGLSGDAVLWLGHASVMIRLAGVTLVIDPVFGARVSPFAAAGPARLSPPVLDAVSLPAPDAVLITHDHYDHFEPESIRQLATRGVLSCIAPLKVGISGLGCASETALDWGDHVAMGAVTVTALPAQHESGRGILDRNTTLWASYLISNGNRRVYVTGDTGYGPHLKEIGAARGPVDLLVMSLGGYKPRDVNMGVHMDPEEAAAAARDIGARKILLVHWGTYPLGLEHADEAIAEFLAAAEAAGLDPASILVLPIGASAPF